MRIGRMFKMLFSPHSQRNEEVTRLVAEAVSASVDSSNRLTQTIREMLDENDRLTGRAQNGKLGNEHGPHR